MTPNQHNELTRVMSAIQDAQRGPAPDALARAPRLDFWQSLLDEHAMPLLYGEVRDHPKLGSTVMTSSRLIAIDRAAKWARTVSRWYRLERPIHEFERDLIEASNRSGLVIRSAAFDFGPFIPINDPKKLDQLLADYILLIRKIALDQRSRAEQIKI